MIVNQILFLHQRLQDLDQKRAMHQRQSPKRLFDLVVAVLFHLRMLQFQQSTTASVA